MEHHKNELHKLLLRKKSLGKVSHLPLFEARNVVGIWLHAEVYRLTLAGDLKVVSSIPVFQ